MHFQTSDLCDKYQTKVQVLAPNFISYGGMRSVCGKIVTCKLQDDNAELIKLLKTDGQNRICVVDVAAKFTAVVGDKLMGFAKENNWAGILVNGYVRDISNTKGIDVGLWALGTCPKKSSEPNNGECNVNINFGGVAFIPGDYLYADEDGIIISEEELFL